MIQEKTLKEEWTNKNYSNDNYSCIAPASLWILTYLNRCYEDRLTWNFFWIINLLWIWYHLYQRWVCKNVPVLNNKVWNFVHLNIKILTNWIEERKYWLVSKYYTKIIKLLPKKKKTITFFHIPHTFVFKKIVIPSWIVVRQQCWFEGCEIGQIQPICTGQQYIFTFNIAMVNVNFVNLRQRLQQLVRNPQLFHFSQSGQRRVSIVQRGP